MKATNGELISLVSYLFEGHDILFEMLTPEGWVNCPLIDFIHPSPDQRYEESYRMYERLIRIDASRGEQHVRHPPEREKFLPEDLSDIDPIGEFRYLLAIAIYEIFSNNHQVIDFTAKTYDLGSLRGAGRFLSEFLNMYYPARIKVYDYMDFYYSYKFMEQRADLTLLFVHVFQKLKKRDMSWIFSIPEIELIDLSEGEIKSFDPHRELLKNQYNEILKQRMEQALERINESLKRELKDKVPVIVSAYIETFGEYPPGWPVE